MDVLAKEVSQPAKSIAIKNKPLGEVYRDFDANLQLWFSLHVVDIERDVTLFNRWQNSSRVARFWNEMGSIDEHRKYLSKVELNPYSLSLIGCFNEEPFSYFEAYWAKHDRLSAHYEAQEFDRGFHLLVGEEHHRGPAKVNYWLRSIVKYLFSDDSRTARVVAEPNVQNRKIIEYMKSCGFIVLKEFDFPHKRAALMILERDRQVYG